MRISSNSFTKKTLNKGTKAWEGENLTSGQIPGDSIEGAVPGQNEFGGIAHFRARTKPVINHE